MIVGCPRHPPAQLRLADQLSNGVRETLRACVVDGKPGLTFYEGFRHSANIGAYDREAGCLRFDQHVREALLTGSKHENIHRRQDGPGVGCQSWEL